MQRVLRRWITPLGSGLLVIFLHFAYSAPASAETAILECVADAASSGGAIAARGREMKMPGLILASFRTWNVTRWSVDKATVLFHIARGESPTTVELATIPQAWGEIEPPKLDVAKLKFVSQRASAEPENWMAIEVPGSLVEDIAANRAHGLVIRFKKDLTVHARESATFAPYLIVMGTRR
jgi:hypothetical protein